MTGADRPRRRNPLDEADRRRAGGRSASTTGGRRPRRRAAEDEETPTDQERPRRRREAPQEQEQEQEQEPEPADRDPEEAAEEPEPEPVDEEPERPRKVPARVVARWAAEQVMEMTGKESESVTSVRRDEDGWTVSLEVVESRRIPDSTDLLAIYEVEMDADGELVGYKRVSRYTRGRGDDD